MLPPIVQFRKDLWMSWSKLCVQAKKYKMQKQICLRNLNKNFLKLDSRAILYAYNLLGYGESITEQVIFQKTKTQKCQKHMSPKLN